MTSYPALARALLLDDDFLRLDGSLDWGIGVARTAGFDAASRLYGPDAVTWSDAAVIRLSTGDTLISVGALEAIARCLTAVSWTAGVQALSQQKSFGSFAGGWVCCASAPRKRSLVTRKLLGFRFALSDAG
jgi:hypothetical protein